MKTVLQLNCSGCAFVCKKEMKVLEAEVLSLSSE